LLVVFVVMEIFLEYKNQGDKNQNGRKFDGISGVVTLEIDEFGRCGSKFFRQTGDGNLVWMVQFADHSCFRDKCFPSFSFIDNEISTFIAHFNDGGHADFVDPLDVQFRLVLASFFPFTKSDLTIGATNPSAFVKTHVYDAFEENEIGFWEFKGLKLGSKQISIFGQEVLKQHWIHSALSFGGS